MRRLRLDPLEHRITPGYGDIDPSFGVNGESITNFSTVTDPNYGNYDNPKAVEVLGDGSILVGGASLTGKQLDLLVARYHRDGTLDAEFGTSGFTRISLPNTSEGLLDMAVLSDGSIVLIGSSLTTDPERGSFTDYLFAGLTPEGALDPRFGSGGVVRYSQEILGIVPDSNSWVRVAVDGLDRIILPLSQLDPVLSPRPLGVGATRILPNGQIDGGFGDNGLAIDYPEFPSEVGTFVARGAAIRPDGRIVVSGSYALGSVISGFLPSGQVDPAINQEVNFAPGVPYGDRVLLQDDGRMVIAGTSYQGIGPGGTSGVTAARFNTDGTLDTTFGDGGTVGVATNGSNPFLVELLSDPDGNLFVVGYTGSNGSPTFAPFVRKYDADGQTDETFGTLGIGYYDFQSDGFTDLARAAAVQPNGDIILAALVYTNIADRDADFGLVRVVNLGTDLSIDQASLAWSKRNADPARRGFEFKFDSLLELTAEDEVAFYWGDDQKNKLGLLAGPKLLSSYVGGPGKIVNEPAHFDVSNRPAGATHILVVLDPSDKIAERSEDNNVAALRIHTEADVLDGAIVADASDNQTFGIVFVPGNAHPDGPFTLSEAEVVFGADHFNWLQQINMPSYLDLEIRRGTRLSSTPVRTGLRLGYDPVANVEGDYNYFIRAKHLPDGQNLSIVNSPFDSPSDAFDPYIQEVPADWQRSGSYGGTQISNLSGGVYRESFALYDAPSLPKGFFRSQLLADSIQFITKLVVMNADHKWKDLPSTGSRTGAFWRSNAIHATEFNKTYFSGRPDDAPPIIAGGIFDVRYDDGVIDTAFPATPPFLPGVPLVPPTVPPISPPATPPVTPPVTRPVGFAVTSSVSGATAVYDSLGGNARGLAPTFDSRNGLRVARGDFNADGVLDVAFASGPGGTGFVQVLDGRDGAILFDLQPFESAFVGGLFVALGDVNGDGFADVVISPDRGGGPRCRVFDGKTSAQLADFFGIDDKAFRGGARAAVGDLNGDGVGDLLVSAGFKGGPRVAGFDGKSLAGTRVKLFSDFFVFEPKLRNGVYLGAGDIDGDGFAEMLAGAGPGGGPRVTVLSGRDLLGDVRTKLADFFAGDAKNRGGVRVAAANLDGDGRADLVVGEGDGAGSRSRVNTYAGSSLVQGLTSPLTAFEAFPDAPGGVFVG